MAAKAKKTAKPVEPADAPFDLEMFRATAELAAAAKTKSSPRQQTGFVIMTHAAARAGYLALDCPQALVWHYLHHRVWSIKSRTVTLPNATLKSWGVNRMSKSRALRKLEQAGLISVESRTRRSPLVTLLTPPNCNARDTEL